MVGTVYYPRLMVSLIPPIKKQVVINQCYGGFSLSKEAQKWIAVRKGISLRHEEKTDTYYVIDYKEHEWETISDHVSRDDPDLIQVVLQLGKAANGLHAELKVVDITIDIDINRHDGMESVFVSGGQY